MTLTDKNYDTKNKIMWLSCGKECDTACSAKEKKHSAIDGRTTRHAGYKVSQEKRKRVEEIFGWMKTVAMLRKTRHKGLLRVGWIFAFAATAYNLVRMRNLSGKQMASRPSQEKCVCTAQGQPDTLMSEVMAKLRRIYSLEAPFSNYIEKNYE